MAASVPSLLVYTHKDGVLARLAHDLQLSLGSFEVELDRRRVLARFVLRSLRVDGVMEAGVLNARALSDRDRAQLLHSANDQVLQSERFPEARFEGELVGDGPSLAIRGELSLRGQPRPVQLELDRTQEQAVIRATLTPSLWGIRPFKALAGAIRLADRVDIVLHLPLRELGAASGDDFRNVSHSWRLGSPRG